ncbi:MAG: fibronectin type III-like domain-contianing protein, partial [Clostridia bacterium]|nr:fibronectin type III-like domain-contianing protein [Clostridia bacterium]
IGRLIISTLENDEYGKRAKRIEITRANPAFINAIAKTYSNAHDIGLREVAKQGLYITYAEGIYLGYKYFETRYEDAVLNQGNATSKAGAVNSEGDWKYSEEVAFPFGYGGSYTTFEYSNFKIVENTDGDFEVTLTVKNAGSKKGADAVQIYSQKPYTEYDKQHGVEEAAVNLVGYAKTAELEAGATQDVKVIVRGDVFKTYDANNAKTYIREKGTYYLTAAQDAHDAVNNILAAKGKTPANTNGVMDAAGNSSLVKAYEFTDDDFTTYAISETGVEITNQFDDTDWNKYENKTEGTLVYLSRKDWAATYPTETIQLSLNDKMVYDLSWDKEVVENPEDEMPLYEQTHVFNLIDLKGLDYDHSAWDTLLDQLSLQDQITLLGTAYHGTEAIAHIAKPAEVTKDGPLGVRQKYKTNSTGYTLSYPSTTLLAASYNDKLALEVGTLMGEDMLHAGITGIYAPGANIHRMTYSGRNYEYYSEDGFMSGMMCKWQVVGIQAAGCYVNVKHIALNDQESNRYGVNIWVNEQAIREVYLPAFEYAVTEGDCTGLMASFTRFGVLWSGAHKGLMTNVLRGEWGFDGFVISDCSWYPFMGVVDGVMAGTDCILDTADPTAYYAAETNATVAQGIRESTHRILYVVVNSNAMNGYSANTRIYEVKEWWQHLVTGVQIGVAAVTGILAIITALTFIFHGKIEAAAAAQDVVIKERKTKKRAMVQEKYGVTYEDDFFGDVKHFYCVGQPWHLERILKTVISCILAAVIVATAILVPVLVGKNTPANPNTGDNGGVVTPGGEGEGDGNENDNTGGEGGEEGEANKYIFEAEVAVLEFVPKKEGKLLTQCGLEGGTKATRFNPSGDAFMYNLEHAKTATLTYYVTAAEDTTATLSYCVGLNQACTADQLFNVTVNGTAATYSTPVAEIPLWSDVTTNSSERYYAWYEKDVMVINLKKGENTIVLEKSTYGLNFDYMALTTEKVTLQDTREAKNGHAYNDWTLITEPTLDKAGKISCYCATCREYVTEELPIISEANGYTKKVVTAGTDTTFGINEWTYVKGNTTFTFTRTESPANAKTFKFEAESMVLGGNAIRGQDIVYGASGNAYVGEFNNKTASVTLNVTADKDCQALLIINFGCRTNATITMNDGRTLTVNDEVVAIADTVKFAQVESSYNWYNWREYEVVVIN